MDVTFLADSRPPKADGKSVIAGIKQHYLLAGFAGNGKTSRRLIKSHPRYS
jgi:hypothetical protein